MNFRALIAVCSLAIAACMVCNSAHAQTWNARINASSGGSCERGVGSRYSFDLSGESVTVSNTNGKMFTTKIGPDGTIDYSFKSPSGAALQAVGNVKTRKVQIVNSFMGCRWDLEPL